MGAILPILLAVVPNLINLVEGLFVHSKSGLEKMSTVSAIVQQLLEKLAANKLIDAKPTDPEVQGVIETILAQMKAQGALVPPGTTPTTPTASGITGDLFLLVGKVTALKAS